MGDDTARTRQTREEETQAQRRRRQPGTIDRMDELTLAIQSGSRPKTQTTRSDGRWTIQSAFTA